MAGTWTVFSSVSPNYQSAVDESRARDAEILAGYRQRYNDAMSALDKQSNQQMVDLETQYANAEKAGMQGLVNAGLTGTTIMPTMRMGYQRQLASARNRLNDSLLNQRLGYQMQLSGDELGYKERAQSRLPTQMDLAGYNLSLGNQAMSAANQYGLRSLGDPSPKTQSYGFNFDTNYQSPTLGAGFAIPRAWWA